MPTTDRDLVQRLSIDDDPLFKILGGLLKPVLSISAAVTVGPLGAMSAALLTEAIGQIEASIKSKEEERTKEMLMGLNEGLAQQGFSPEDLVRRIEALSSQNKVILFNIVGWRSCCT